jgi:hypothetical protein
MIHVLNIKQTKKYQLIHIPRELLFNDHQGSKHGCAPLKTLDIPLLCLEHMTLIINSKTICSYSIVLEKTYLEPNQRQALALDNNPYDIVEYASYPMTKQNQISINHMTTLYSGFFIETDKQLTGLSVFIHDEKYENPYINYDEDLLDQCCQCIYKYKSEEYEKTLYHALHKLPIELIDIINDKVDGKCMYYVPMRPFKKFLDSTFVVFDNLVIKLDQQYDGMIHMVRNRMLVTKSLKHEESDKLDRIVEIHVGISRTLDSNYN